MRFRLLGPLQVGHHRGSDGSEVQLDVGPPRQRAVLAAFTSAVGRAGSAVEAALWDVALADSEGALSLWRGPFLDDPRNQPWVGVEATTAEELRRECLDYWISELLALGRVPPALIAAARLSAADPLSDRGCWLHVLALYRAGHTSEALDAYTRHPRTLDVELGLEPGTESRELQTAILRQAPELAAWPRHPEWTGAVEVATPTGHRRPIRRRPNCCDAPS